MVTDLTEARSSEDNLGNLYRRWAEFMEAESWEELVRLTGLDPSGNMLELREPPC